MLNLIMKTDKVEEVGKTFTHFYLELDNGYRIRIKNVFKNDFVKLRLLAKKED